MKPLFSIVTPTVLRPSLAATIRSIDAQSCEDWEHIIVIDMPEATAPAWDGERRRWYVCDTAHRNAGNSCRHFIWPDIRCELVIDLDDDDLFCDVDALALIAEGMGDAQWGIFPALRFGEAFFNGPPGINRTMCCQFVRRPVINGCYTTRFSNTNYTAEDGILVENMMKLTPPAIIDPGFPLVRVDKQSRGERPDGLPRIYDK